MADDEPLKSRKTFQFTRIESKSSRTTVKLSLKRTKKTAEDVSERLNAEEDRREQDRWSA